jgi:hypothetical protein
VAVVPACRIEHEQRRFVAPGESPIKILSGGMTAVPLGIALPIEGVILEL